MDELEELARKRVGITLRGKYRLDALLGVGGMAAVYRGSHRNGHRVAVKILHPDLARSEVICERFAKEGYVANAVPHPGALRVIDDDKSDDGAPFLVMELLEGKTLDVRLEEAGGKLQVEEVCALAYQLLDVLAAAHTKGIIHRDIKPENLFVTHGGELKILDFGIARMREGANSNLTRTGQAMGTPAFMPQEQALGHIQKIDGRTDIWAVGATMFVLLTGAYVHEAETFQELMVFAATRPARSIRSVAPALSPAIAALIDKSLAFAMSDRFATAQAMRSALAEAFSTSFGHAMPRAQTRIEVGLASAGASKDTPASAVEELPEGNAPTVYSIADVGSDPEAGTPTEDIDYDGDTTVKSTEGVDYHGQTARLAPRTPISPTFDDTAIPLTAHVTPLPGALGAATPRMQRSATAGSTEIAVPGSISQSAVPVAAGQTVTPLTYRQAPRASTTAGLSTEIAPPIAPAASVPASSSRRGLPFVTAGGVGALVLAGIFAIAHFASNAGGVAAASLDGQPGVVAAIPPSAASAPPPPPPTPTPTVRTDPDAGGWVVPPIATSTNRPAPTHAPPPPPSPTAAPTRDCVKDHLDPITRKTRPECSGQ